MIFKIQKIVFVFLILGLSFFLYIEKVNASICPDRPQCPNKCDLTGTECGPINGVPQTCSEGERGWYCINKIKCDPNLPNKLEQQVYQCDGHIWKDLGRETPDSDCAGFCIQEGAPSPTAYPEGAAACKDRPFAVEFTSSHPLGPGESVTCSVEQVNQSCEPCTGLKRKTQCSFGQTEKGCVTADTDCLCKFGGVSYSCTLNGVPFQGGSSTIPPNLIKNASSVTINIDPSASTYTECQLNKSCSSCNGNLTTCYPDCAGGTCSAASGGVCTSCPAAPLTCTVGQSCANKCSNDNNDVCYPGCNGGSCVNGVCQTCSEAGVAPQPSPTPVQAKSAVTIGPTFTPGGAGAPPPAQTQRWVCLSATGCSDPFSLCSGKGDVKHRVVLSTGKTAQALPNQPTYIFDCMIGPNGPECTSGSAAVDTFALQKNMTGIYGYQFKGFFKNDGVNPQTNPFLSGNLGDIPRYEWEATTTSSIGHVYFAMNPINPRAFSGTDPTTKQSTFLLGSPDSTCSMITSDPYGRVFNSKTLEPIKNAEVTLLKKTESGTFMPVQKTDVAGGIENPTRTSENGSFFFRVPDGTYKLKVIAKNYSFPASKKNVNARYGEIYEDIYIGEEIVQKGTITHHDIPLDPIDIKQSENLAKQTPPQIMSLNQTLEHGVFTIQGVVSHPLSHITIYGKKVSGKTMKRTRTLTTIQADSHGTFKTYVKEKALGSHEIVGDVEIVKPTLYSTHIESKSGMFKSVIPLVGSFIKKVLGQERTGSTTIALKPMLGNLEGYAYLKGSILANATVKIYLPFSNEPVTKTQTDERGYFHIANAYLPTMPYMIKYQTATGKLIEKSITDFMVENESQ